MMRRMVCILIAVFLMTALLPASAEKVSCPVTVEGALFCGNGGPCETELVFDPAWVTEGDPTVYNGDLAAFCALVSAETYFREKDLDRGTPNRVLTGGTDPVGYERMEILAPMGFTDHRHVESYQEREYETDRNDSVTMDLARMDAEEYEIYLIAVRGCFSIGEWHSIFDPGNAEDPEEAHPEWTDRNTFKGIAVAAERALEIIGEYLKEHDDPERTNCFLVTGHSRGGGIAQLIAAHLEKGTGCRSTAYLFNTPPVTTDPAAEEYRTIFHLFDANDIFTGILPFGAEDWYRCGRVLSVPISEREEIAGAIAGLSGGWEVCAPSEELLAEYRAAFGARFPDRASLYLPRSRTEHYDGKDEAEERREELLNLTWAENGLGMEELCAIGEVTECPEGGYDLAFGYTDAALLYCMGSALAYGSAVADALKVIFPEEEEYLNVIGLLMDHTAEVKGGHLLGNSYVMTGAVE